MHTPFVRTPFDPADPLPRKTLRDLLATGAGQAAPARLVACSVIGVGGTLALGFMVPRWWVASAPFACLAAFAAWALASQRLLFLDAYRRRVPAQRALLHLTRAAAVTVAMIASAVAFVEIVALLMKPQSLG